MPNIKSQVKRVKTSKNRNMSNSSKMSNLRTVIKKAMLSFETKSSEMEANYLIAIKALDMACSKNLLHKNNVARKKSQLTKAYNTAKA